MNATHSIETPRGISGAIAMIRVQADDLPATLEALGIGPVAPNAIKLGDLLGVDTGVIASWGDDAVMLMPHGGVAIVRAISAALSSRGVALVDDADGAFPEASDLYETRMLRALGRAQSPLAVDVLLDQPRRWRLAGDDATDLADALVLGRLIDPPIVAAVGRANIGKSSLLNAIAGVHVALVADASGTTRDHVGVSVDLAGLVVHWVDTPGVDERVGDDDAVVLAVEVVRRAALVVHCVDAGAGDVSMDPRLAEVIDSATPIVVVRTRADQGSGGNPVGIETSAATGAGIEDLVRAVRDGLVGPEILADGRPWRFWKD